MICNFQDVAEADGEVDQIDVDDEMINEPEDANGESNEPYEIETIDEVTESKEEETTPPPKCSSSKRSRSRSKSRSRSVSKKEEEKDDFSDAELDSDVDDSGLLFC